MNDLESALDTAVNLLQKLYGLPAIALVLIGCLVLGYALKWIPSFPNSAIPLAVILFGGVVFPIIADANNDLTFRVWLMRNALIGLAVGFTSWVFHNRILNPIEDKLAGDAPAKNTLMGGNLKLAFLCGLCALCVSILPARAQSTNSTPSILGPAFDTAVDFFAKGSNFIGAPYGIYASQPKKYGAGVAFGYKLSDYVVPFIRGEELGGSFYMVSGTMQLQLPIRVPFATNMTFIPFGVGGVGTALGGGGVQNGTAIAIMGAGGALKISRKFDLLFDVEKWGGFQGLQYRAGFGWWF